MQLLIIEDEPEALEGMKRMMERLQARTQRIFYCARAAEALEVIESHRPELIVTDIVLPDSTGLDLLEQVCLPGYRPKVVIVSGFDDFEYAKRGMKLGAVDYFLKPFDTDSFCEKIAACMEEIEREETERQNQHRDAELAHLGTRSMRDVFLISLCLQPTYLQEHVLHRLRTWDLEWMAAGPYSVIALTARTFATELSEQEEEILSFATGNIVDELLQNHPPSIAFRNPKKYWMIVTPLEDVRSLIETLGAVIFKYQKIQVRFGVSERMSSFQMMHAAYRQAVDCLRASLLSKNEQVVVYEQWKPLAGNKPEDISDLMLGAVESKDDERIREAAMMYVQSLVMQGNAVHPNGISQRCMDWIIALQEALRRKAELPFREIPVALWDEMDDCATMDDLGAAIARYFIDISWQLKGVNRHSIVEQAMKRIHQSFTEDLTLQTLADELAIHPVSLSQLFKKEVGTNFLDYVTELRVQRAKELLRHSNLKIYEIAEAVGYQDFHYFGRLFKKKTGVTPKEHRYGR